MTLEKPFIRYTQLFINNEWRESTSQRKSEVTNPATEEILAYVSEGGEEDIDLAVTSARNAYEQVWSKVSIEEKRRLLYRVGELMEGIYKKELVELECLDNGKPWKDAELDVKESANCFQYYSGWTDKLFGKTWTTTNEYRTYTRREPIGVCGLIIPWNYPLLMASWKLAPALACGNTVVLKPSEVTPLSSLRLAELFKEAGFPAGVVNIVPGSGKEAGMALVRHKGIDKISFTGSTAVGRKVMEASAQSNLKRITLELGGKSPMIVFADADLEKAVNDTWDGAFMNMGQNCCCGSRLFVEASIYDKFVEMLLKKEKEVKLGGAFEEGSNFGPLVSKMQLDKVESFVQTTKISEGLIPIMGGKKLNRKGYFFPPTLYTHVKDESRLSREEIFGPIMSILTPFNSLEEVIQRANNTPYGLAAGVWTCDMNKAEKVVRALKAGTVWINCYNLTPCNIPFGGMKESGFGRDLGEEALQEFTQVKAVTYQFDL